MEMVSATAPRLRRNAPRREKASRRVSCATNAGQFAPRCAVTLRPECTSLCRGSDALCLHGSAQSAITQEIGKARPAPCTVVRMDNITTPNNDPEPLRRHLRSRLADLGFARLAEATDRLTAPEAPAMSEAVPS